MSKQSLKPSFESKDSLLDQPVTMRAVCIGLIFSVLLNLIMLYSDFYLENTFLVGNHFPVASLGVLMLLVLVINPLLRGLGKGQGLGMGELLLIWGMIGISGGIGAAGFMRYLPGWLASPGYLATPSNGFDEYLLKFLPKWMILSHDPKNLAAKWFFEGLPSGASIPWSEWMLPLGAWFAFGAFLYFTFFALTSLFYQQWAVKERLTFALIHLPLDLAREAEPGKKLNAFLKNPVTWLGASLPIVHNLVNGSHKYFPAVPEIPFAWPGKWFTDRPWSELDMGSLILYYSVIGLSFLLTTEMSFSIWFFYFLYRLSFVYVAWLGTGATGFWGDWGNQVGSFESAGAVLVLAFFLVWTARKFFKEWMGRVISGKRDPEADALHPRLTLLLLLAGFGGMQAWLLAAGLPWWMAAGTLLIFLAVVLVLTRIVAEAGMLSVGTGVSAMALATGLAPLAWLTGPVIAVLAMQQGVLMGDLQGIALPYLMNGLKATGAARLATGKVLGAFALAALIAFGVSAYGRISTNYKFGGANLDKLGSVWTAQWGLGGAVSQEKNPAATQSFQIGSTNVISHKAAHVVIGAVVTAGMLALRSSFLWWPLHPLGLVICTQVSFSWIWFSIFLGWLAKSSVMSFGGASVYRKLLPFFLGLIMGEYLIALFWMAVSFWIGSPGFNLLMHW